MYVIIKSIANPYLLSEANYAWLRARLNTPLPVMSIYWDRPEQGSGAWHMTIFTGPDTQLSLFVEGCGITYELKEDHHERIYKTNENPGGYLC